MSKKYWEINDNFWDKSIYTEENAIKAAQSMHNCHNCYDCNNCDNCHSCNSCYEFKQNPKKYARDDLGTKHTNTCIYWTHNKIQVVCGCFIGTPDEFRTAVIIKYSETHAYIDYLNTCLDIIQKEKLS